MAWYHEIRASVIAIFRRRSQEAELAEEMKFHVEMEAERRAALGEEPHEAVRQAQRNFGGVERYKDDVRDERGSQGWDHFRRDVGLSFRSIGHRRGFAALVVGTLALGIGAATTLFGVVNAVLLTPLPYGRPEGIAVVWSAWKQFDRTWLSWDEYEMWDAQIRSFADVGLISLGSINLTDGDTPERVRFAQVGASVFPILGVSPLLGRNFSEAEDALNGERVVVLSHALWERRYESDPSVVGRTIMIDGTGARVIGVMPRGFKLPFDFGSDGPTLAWMPLATDAESEGAIPGPASRPGGGSHGYNAVARLAPGATVELANRDLAARVLELNADGTYPPDMGFRAFTTSVSEHVTGRIKPVLLVTVGAVTLLLLIACANVAALMLVRGEQRRRELALRMALGAGSGRLTRLLLTESLIIASCGGAIGVALAFIGAAAIRAFAPSDLPRMAETHVDIPVILSALAATVLAAVLTGVLPALQARGVAPARELKDGGRSVSAGGGRLRWRQLLVTTEIAFAVVVVVGAGLMVRTVRNLLAVDRGFDGRGVLTMQISTPASTYADSIAVANFWSELTRQVNELPSVRHVGAVRQLPLASDMGDWGMLVEGYTPPPHQGTPGDWQVVTPGYFETMGLTLRTGRFLETRDDMASPLALVVNQTFVATYIGDREPLGVRVQIGARGPDFPWYTIVGIVDDVRHNGLTERVKPQFYATLAHFARAPANTRRSMHLVVSSTADPGALVTPIRQIVRDLDPRLPVSEVRSMDDVLSAAIAEQQFAMRVLSFFGFVALALATIGVFGVVSQVVSQRQQEFGIRAALGATPGDLVARSLRMGVQQAVMGLIGGIAAALLTTRALSALLYDVSASDPWTFASVALAACAATLAASALPAWRAARRSPSSVLFDG